MGFYFIFDSLRMLSNAYVVDLAGVEPASEITTPSVLHA